MVTRPKQLFFLISQAIGVARTQMEQREQQVSGQTLPDYGHGANDLVAVYRALRNFPCFF
jgi:hypothetical protein